MSGRLREPARPRRFGAPYRRALLGLIGAALLAGAAATVALGDGSVTTGEINAAHLLTANGRQLAPAGRLSLVGNFPTGGALTLDGRFYWAVDSGLGHNDVKVIDVAGGTTVQSLPLPGAYGGIAFSPDGRTAYVSGEPKGDIAAEGPTKGDAGDVIHVFSVDPATGRGTEQDPIALPKPSSGLDWPVGLAVSPNGRQLVVALNQKAEAAVIDLATRQARLVGTGDYPTGVAITRDGRYALVTCEQSGTVDVIDLAAATRTKQIPLGGALGNTLAHPEGITLDPRRALAYVAVASRDEIAVIDTDRLELAHEISVQRPEGLGAQPVDVAVTPDGSTLYAADSGEDAIAAISLTDRPLAASSRRAVRRRARSRRRGRGTHLRSGRRTAHARTPRAPKRHAASHHRRTPATASNGAIPGLPAYSLIGRIPTAAYPSAVAVTPDGSKVLWIAAKGLGTGPNIGYQQFAFNAAPYGTYTPTALVGRLGVLARPTDLQAQAYTAAADREVTPSNAAAAPPGSPVVGPGGGPSQQIKHVFYIVRENRTYDQIFGTDPRGDGAPALELFDDNSVPGAAAGVTPNAHRLAHIFPLLDHVYANSEVSIDGHIITDAGWAIDHVQKTLHANYGNRGRVGDTDALIGLPPRDSIFDQAVRQHVSFENYGESTGGAGPNQDDGRPTYAAVRAGTSSAYPFLDTDAGAGEAAGLLSGATPGGHFDVWNASFQQQLANGSVPALNYITLPIDHTLGTTPGIPTPRAFVADNDLALGQFVEAISHSSIWPQSAIFVVEDDSQDGADHVDAHRMPAFVISPWAKRGAVIHTRYDQNSVLHTIELILGLKPLSLMDGLATPMYDAFDTTADVESTRYTAVAPTQPLKQLNTPASPDAALSAKLPFDRLDLVPQLVMDRILWHSVYGASSTPPAAGPNASPIEHQRALGVLDVLAHGGDARAWLLAHSRGGENLPTPGAPRGGG
jgi:DNA-binding beta-propeller fold protein YncE